MTRAAVTLAFTRGAKQCQHLFFFPPTTICQLYVTWHTLACATYATLDTYLHTYKMFHKYEHNNKNLLNGDMAFICRIILSNKEEHCPSILHWPKDRLFFSSYLYTIHQTCMQQYTLHTQWSSCSGLSENSWSIGCTEGARHCSSLQNISRIFWAPVQSVQPEKSPSRTPQNPKSWAPKRAWEGLNLTSVQPEKASLKVRKPALKQSRTFA